MDMVLTASAIQKISQEPVSLETPIGEGKRFPAGRLYRGLRLSFRPLRRQLLHAVAGAPLRLTCLPIVSARSSCALALSTGIPARSRKSAASLASRASVSANEFRPGQARHLSRSSKLKDYIES